eukprot:13436928-Alexandrium_andersonii.AAC.1
MARPGSRGTRHSRKPANLDATRLLQEPILAQRGATQRNPVQHGATWFPREPIFARPGAIRRNA